MNERQRFEGNCDVCGAPLELVYPSAGILDIGVDDGGRVYTWRRHYATAPEGADPDCAVYSSRVYEVPWPRKEEPESDGPTGWAPTTNLLTNDAVERY